MILRRIFHVLRNIERGQEAIVATFEEVRADYLAWGQQCLAQRDQAVASLTAAQAQVQSLTDQLSAASSQEATDLAAQSQTLANELSTDLDTLKTAGDPPPPTSTPDPTPPVDTTPPADTPPVDTTPAPPADTTPAPPADTTPPPDNPDLGIPVEPSGTGQ